MNVLSITKEFLVEYLINKTLPISYLISEYGYSRVTIIRYCKKYGIYDLVKQLRKKEIRKGHNLNDLTGLTFGDIKVISRDINDKFSKARWLCSCSCGRNKVINGNSLVKGLTKSCGFCKKNTGYKEVSGSYINSAKSSAFDRGLEFSITAEDVWNQYIKQDKKCILTGLDIKFLTNMDKQRLQTASIDRIDSSKGYVKNNIRIIHKKVNLMRGAMNDKEFLVFINLIYNHNKNICDGLSIDEITTSVQKYDNCHIMS